MADGRVRGASSAVATSSSRTILTWGNGYSRFLAAADGESLIVPLTSHFIWKDHQCSHWSIDRKTYRSAYSGSHTSDVGSPRPYPTNQPPVTRCSQGLSTSRSRTSSAWRWVSVLSKTCCR